MASSRDKRYEKAVVSTLRQMTGRSATKWVTAAQVADKLRTKGFEVTNHGVGNTLTKNENVAPHVLSSGSRRYGVANSYRIA